MLEQEVELSFVFSTHVNDAGQDAELKSNGFFHRIENLRPGEARAYRMSRPDIP